jgi:hypothetical protein
LDNLHLLRVHNWAGFVFHHQSKLLTKVTFERASRVSVIGEFAFEGCSHLRSICLPSTIEVVGQRWFPGGSVVSGWRFERGSKLSEWRNRLKMVMDCQEKSQLTGTVSAIEQLWSHCEMDFD